MGKEKYCTRACGKRHFTSKQHTQHYLRDRAPCSYHVCGVGVEHIEVEDELVHGARGLRQVVDLFAVQRVIRDFHLQKRILCVIV
jgi:hypothetical protein